MATPNQYTTDFSLNQGQSAENIFAALAKSKGYTVTLASPYQERVEHWDFLLEKDGSPSLRVEIKSLKSFSIYNKDRRTSDFFLLENKGISGHDGWLWGKANVVAFERADGFFIVPKSTLQKIYTEKVSKTWVDRRENMLYKTYGRKDRQDEVSAILISDVTDTKNFSFWKK